MLRLLIPIFLLAILYFEDTLAIKRPDFYAQYAARARLTKQNTKTNPKMNSRHVQSTDYNKLNFRASMRCCKTGEKWADLGMSCRFDPRLGGGRQSYLRALMKYNNDRNPRKTFSSFNAYSVKAIECFKYKTRFEKCCNYRRHNPKSIEECRRLKPKSRKRCEFNFHKNNKSTKN